MRGVPNVDLWKHISDALSATQVAQDFELDDPGFNSDTPIARVADWLQATSNIGGSLDEGWDVAAPLQEHELYRWGREPEEGPETVPGMLYLLLLVAQRIGSPATAAANTEDWDIVTEGRAGRLAMSRFFVELRKRAMAGETMDDLARWIVNDYVIRQHERVAVGKLPDDTYRFRRDGDSIRFFDQEAGAGLNNSRFEALSTCIYELGFVDSLWSSTHTLTKDGRTLLEAGDLAERPLAAAMSAMAESTP